VALSTGVWLAGIGGAVVGAVVGFVVGLPEGGVGAIPGAIFGGIGGFSAGAGLVTAIVGAREDAQAHELELRIATGTLDVAEASIETAIEEWGPILGAVAACVGLVVIGLVLRAILRRSRR